MAKTETEEPETETVEPDKASIKEAVLGILSELGITKSSEPTEEIEKVDDPEEIESPRQQESRMRKSVESVVEGLHIHIDSPREKEKAEKAEPEGTPGKKPFLERFFGLSA